MERETWQREFWEASQKEGLSRPLLCGQGPAQECRRESQPSLVCDGHWDSDAHDSAILPGHGSVTILLGRLPFMA